MYTCIKYMVLLLYIYRMYIALVSITFGSAPSLTDKNVDFGSVLVACRRVSSMRFDKFSYFWFVRWPYKRKYVDEDKCIKNDIRSFWHFLMIFGQKIVISDSTTQYLLNRPARYRKASTRHERRTHQILEYLVGTNTERRQCACRHKAGRRPTACQTFS